jgi:predicted transposase/invertase (TIGR01784 family)
MTEIWRDIFKNIPPKEAERKGFRLPVIVPIVLYNGSGKWTAPLNFKETLDGFELFSEQVLDFRYILINVHAYEEKELLELSNLLGAVFLVDQARDLKEIIERLKKLAETIRKMEPEEFRIFTAWAKNILTRSISTRKNDEIRDILTKTRPEEVEEMISNVERVIQKSLEDAEKQGIEKVARQMLAKGFDIETIMSCTNLSREEIEKLKE